MFFFFDIIPYFHMHQSITISH